LRRATKPGSYVMGAMFSSNAKYPRGFGVYVVSGWVGEKIALHCDAKHHFLQFNLTWETETVNRSWGCMWTVVVGEIWKQRNLIIFKNGRVDSSEIFSLAQLKAWSWLSSKESLVDFSYAQWCMEPKECLKSIKKDKIRLGRGWSI